MNRLQILLLTTLILLPPSALLAQAPGGRKPREGERPCDFVTQSDAESILGESVVARRAGDYQCWFAQDGFTGKAPTNKQVSLSVWYSTSPQPNDVNTRRIDVASFGRTATTVVKDVTDFADAAIWTWTPGWGGRFIAFKGGTIQAEVSIGGIAEDAALAASKKLAARALGGAGKSGYAYAGAPKSSSAQARAGAVDGAVPSVRDPIRSLAGSDAGPVPVSVPTAAETSPAPPAKTIGDNYNVPGILRPLYYGQFDQIGDDEMTRNYVISLVQQFRRSCYPGPPELIALMDYAAYYERRANGEAYDAARDRKSGDASLQRGFEAIEEVMHRAHGHILPEGREDATTFLNLHPRQNGTCLTPPVKHLYENIAKLALQRRSLPPDVNDMYRYSERLSKKGLRHYSFDPGLPRVTPEQRVKRACLDFTKAPAFPEGEEGFCRCFVDAAVEAKVMKSDLELLASHFSRPPSAEIYSRNAAFKKRMEGCRAIAAAGDLWKVGLAARTRDQEKWNAPRFSVGAYEPKWLGQQLVLRGTVSRVTVDSGARSPHWLTIFFKESPDAAFVVCSPYPYMFQGIAAGDFSALIGKTLEVAGHVEHPYCAGKGASIRVVESGQYRVQ